MSDDRSYRVTLSFAPERQRFVARVPELGLEVEAESRTAAIEAAEAAVEARVEAAATGGERLPAPIDAAEHGGELTLSLAGPVHRDLLHAAQAARLAPEQLAAQLLSHALGARSPAGRPRTAQAEEQGPPRDQDDRRGNRAPEPARSGRRRQEGYRPDLDDKGHFLAYVRDLEKGGGGGGRGGRGR